MRNALRHVPSRATNTSVAPSFRGPVSGTAMSISSSRFRELATIVCRSVVVEITPPVVAAEPSSAWSVSPRRPASARTALARGWSECCSAVAAAASRSFCDPRVVTIWLTVTTRGSQNDLLAAAATAEQHSDHPLARAVLAEAGRRGLTLQALEGSAATKGGVISTTTERQTIVANSRNLLEEMDIAVPDTGPRNDGATEVFVALDGTCLSALRIEDAPREASRHAVDTLRRMNIR